MTLYTLIGPTAVGKTELSLCLAESLGSPYIISADSRQMFRDLPVCTAAPTVEQQKRIDHRYVGILGLEDSYSAAQFERDVMEDIYALQNGAQSHINNNDKSPSLLVCGGSMFYIDALVRGIDDMPDADPTIRQTLKERLAAEGLASLVLQLQNLDPDYCHRADLNNTQRVVHALEMCLTTGKAFSSFHTGKVKQRPFDIVQIGLTRNRESLDRRIVQRVDQMFQDGLLEETEAIFARYEESIVTQFREVVGNPGPTQAQPIPNLTPVSLNTVGLKEMLLFYTGIYSLEQARERIIHNTRIYSKKQLTWFRRNTAIKWHNLDETDDILLSTLVNHT